MIARQLPGRTDNDVKNYWNTKLRKKLAKMGIDPVTHKPIPQVMSDYGSISRLPSSTSTTGAVPRPSSSITPGIIHPMRNYNPAPDANFYPGISAAAWNQLPCQYQESIVDQRVVQPQHLPIEVSSSSSSSSSTLTKQFISSSKPGYSIPPQAPVAPCPPFTLPGLLPDNQPLVDSVLQRQRISIQPEIFSPAIEDTSPSEHRARRVRSTLGSRPDGHNKATYPSNKSDDPLYRAASGDQQDHWYGASSSPGCSFVDSILRRDSQIQQEFPELLDVLLDD